MKNHIELTDAETIAYAEMLNHASVVFLQRYRRNPEDRTNINVANAFSALARQFCDTLARCGCVSSVGTMTVTCMRLNGHEGNHGSTLSTMDERFDKLGSYADAVKTNVNACAAVS